MRYTLGCLALVSLLVGCAPTIWDKPGATAQDFERDKFYCLQQARTREVRVYGSYAYAQDDTNWPIYWSCIQAQGWQRIK